MLLPAKENPSKVYCEAKYEVDVLLKIFFAWLLSLMDRFVKLTFKFGQSFTFDINIF